jgi:SAGA-associated factor 29
MSTPTTQAPTRGVSITLPPRGSVGPSPAIPFSRDPKARREALAKQLPLHEGRKVAFHPPAGKPNDGTATDADENTWILAVVTRCINQDKNRWDCIEFISAPIHVYFGVDTKFRIPNLKKMDNPGST